MAGGFDKNVAREMPRSGKGGEPRTPWDVAPAAGPSESVAVATRPMPSRFPSLERGKSDVLDKIRDLKTELEGAFASREELQSKLNDAEVENRSLKDKVENLTQERADLKDRVAVLDEKKESHEKRIAELETNLESARNDKDALQDELAEARLALDEIYGALQG